MPMKLRYPVACRTALLRPIPVGQRLRATHRVLAGRVPISVAALPQSVGHIACVTLAWVADRQSNCCAAISASQPTARPPHSNPYPPRGGLTWPNTPRNPTARRQVSIKQPAAIAPSQPKGNAQQANPKRGAASGRPQPNLIAPHLAHPLTGANQ